MVFIHAVGTWLGVTRQGRITILTNFRESSSAAAIGARSRGAMVNAFLTAPDSSVRPLNEWVHHLLTADGEEGCKHVGGFSLICGTIRPQTGTTNDERIQIEPLAVLSNRTGCNNEHNKIHWICDKPDQIHALSNDPFADPNPWPKVTLGKELLTTAITTAVDENLAEEHLVETLFGVLSHETIPTIVGRQTYDTDLESVRHSIFIPAFDVHQEGQPQNVPDSKEIVNDTDVIHSPATTSGVDTLEKPATIISTNGNATVQSICVTPTISHFTSDLQAPTGVPFDSPRVYGTQKQTVILVDRNGRLKYIERTLYNENAEWMDFVENKDRDVVCEFQIEGWGA